MRESEGADVRRSPAASMVSQGGMVGAAAAAVAPQPGIRSAEEFADAFRSLDRVQMAAIRQSLAGLAVIARSGQDDLLHEVFLRVLDGRRSWPADVELPVFVYQTARSVAGAEARGRKRSPYRSAVSVNGEDGSVLHHGSHPHDTPEDNVAAMEMLRRAEAEFYEMCQGDEAAEMILLGIQEGLEGEALREMTGLSITEFSSKRRWVRRRLNALRTKLEASG